MIFRLDNGFAPGDDHFAAPADGQNEHAFGQVQFFQGRAHDFGPGQRHGFNGFGFIAPDGHGRNDPAAPDVAQNAVDRGGVGADEIMNDKPIRLIPRSFWSCSKRI